MHREICLLRVEGPTNRSYAISPSLGRIIRVTARPGALELVAKQVEATEEPLNQTDIFE